MAMPDITPGSGLEIERQSRVLIDFYGHSHHQANLGGIPTLIDRLTLNIEANEGAHVLFLESAVTDIETAKSQTYYEDKDGLQNTLVFAALQLEWGRNPRPEEIETRKSLIDNLNGDIDLIVGHRLLPQISLRQYFLYKEVDRLREKYSLEVIREAHPASTVNRIRTTLPNARHFSDLAYEAWSQRDFQKFEEFARATKQIIDGGVRLRDQDIIEQLVKIAKKLKTNPKGGTLFISLGDAHNYVVEVLGRKLRGEEYLIRRLSEAAYIDLNPSKALLYGSLLSELGNFFAGMGRTASFSQHWKEINEQAYHIIDNLSHEEIKALCENNTNLLSFFVSRGLEI